MKEMIMKSSIPKVVKFLFILFLLSVGLISGVGRLLNEIGHLIRMFI